MVQAKEKVMGTPIKPSADRASDNLGLECPPKGGAVYRTEPPPREATLSAWTVSELLYVAKQ